MSPDTVHCPLKNRILILNMTRDAVLMLWLGLDTADEYCNHTIWTTDILYKIIQKRQQYHVYVIVHNELKRIMKEVMMASLTYF